MDFHDRLASMADEARRASSIQEAVTDARMVLGIGASATYTEDLANVFMEVAERARNLRDPDVTAFLNRLNEAATAGDPVTLWCVDYLPADKAMELPLDADGVPVRPGDELESRFGSTYVRTAEAVGVGSFFACCEDDTRFYQYDAQAFRHRRSRTIDDIKADATDGRHDSPEGIVALIHEAYELGQKEGPF